LLQAGIPELDGTGRYPLLQLEIAGSDLDDTLIKSPLFAMLFQPDFLEGLMAFEKKPLIELINSFEKTRIVLGFHQARRPCRMRFRCKTFRASLESLSTNGGVVAIMGDFPFMLSLVEASIVSPAQPSCKKDQSA